jgi:hypothetical protein
LPYVVLSAFFPPLGWVIGAARVFGWTLDSHRARAGSR